MSCIHIFTPHFLQFFNLQKFLIICFCEFVNRCSEFTLIGWKCFFEIFWNNKSFWFFQKILPMEFPNLFLFSTSNHIRYPILRIINFSHHELTIVLSHLRIEMLWRREKNIPIKWAIFGHSSKRFDWHSNIKLFPKNFWIKMTLYLVHSFEDFCSSL